MNRCRARRRLRRVLEDWTNMLHHGYNADVVPAWQVGACMHAAPSPAPRSCAVAATAGPVEGLRGRGWVVAWRKPHHAEYRA